MKLSELKKQKIPFEIADGDNVFRGYFKSVSVADRAEKDAFYEHAKEQALEYTRRYVPSVLEAVKKYDDAALRENILKYQKSYLYQDEDLLEIENENLETKDEVERKRLEEIKKSIEYIEKQNREADREELEFYFAIMELREIYLYKIVSEVDKKLLTLITLDEDGNRVLSMDETSEDYIGNLSEDVFMELLEKSADIRIPATQQELRRVLNDPDFLLLWERLKTEG